MCGVELTRISRVRDLGVVYSDKLDFEEFIHETVANDSSRANVILRAFKTREPELLFSLFNLYVRPILEYRLPACQIERMQCQVSKSVSSLNQMTYEARLRALSLFLPGH